MSKLIVGNWKMRVPTLKAALKLANSFEGIGKLRKKVDVVVCPPFPFLAPVGEQWDPFDLGAQDLFWEAEGAYTGETAASMLRSVGTRYVIIGHSERRRYRGETDEQINKKVQLALKAGLRVILCVGEPEAMRQRGVAMAKGFVRDQLYKNLKGISSRSATRRNLAVVYEPLWAISTSRGSMEITPEQAVDMMLFMKNVLGKAPLKLQARMVYGGSIDAGNAADFLQHKEIEGALVGAASLKPADFKKIVQVAAKF